MKKLNSSWDCDNTDTRSYFVAGRKFLSLHNNPTLDSQIFKLEQNVSCAVKFPFNSQNNSKKIDYKNINYILTVQKYSFGSSIDDLKISA